MVVADELRRCSRWIMRAMEWDEPRARYPNLWHEGMPRHMMALETVARRLRLGDLVAIYHPSSARRPERSNRFLGIARVVGLRHSDVGSHCWIDLETAHRLDPPLDPKHPPRRVVLCCDPGWPEIDRALFRHVFDAAVAAGWQPSAEEREPPAGPPADAGRAGDAAPPRAARVARADEPARDAAAGPDEGEVREEGAARDARPAADRLFGGVHFSGDMRDPRDATWLAVVGLRGERLEVVRLEATGRHGLQSQLRDPDTMLMHVEAIGLDFPFGLPLSFAERILDGPFPDEGWWALARRMERLSRPDYLVAVQEFREAQGEPKRWTDEQAHAFSPLHRVNPDLGPMTYHGIRLIAEERSRYAVKPFETAQGRLLFEVYPGGLTRRLKTETNGGKLSRREAILAALAELPQFPVDVAQPHRRFCLTKRDALDAVIAARCAAAAVLSGETDKTVEALSPEHADRVRLEGWIYGLEAGSALP